MRFGIMGAGAIGCYVGGRLALAGNEVVLVGRASLGAEIAAHGLRLSDYTGRQMLVPGERLRFADAASALADCDAVVVTVKSLDTADAGRQLVASLPARAVVVSLQNGVRNPEALREVLPGHPILAAMVPFNVVRKPEATFHLGTSGHLVIQASVEPAAQALIAALRRAGLPVEERRDVAAVQWGKLILNLNNAVNALSGLTVLAMTSDARYRRVMAATVAEAASTLRVARRPAKLNLPLPPWLLAPILRLPDAWFRRIARSMLTIDPEARASMQDDLSRGRLTEVDQLNGEIVRLADAHSLPAPVNAGLVALIHAAEQNGRGSPQLDADELARRLGL